MEDRLVERISNRIVEIMAAGIKKILVNGLLGIDQVFVIIFAAGFIVLMYDLKMGRRMILGGLLLTVFAEVVKGCL